LDINDQFWDLFFIVYPNPIAYSLLIFLCAEKDNVDMILMLTSRVHPYVSDFSATTLRRAQSPESGNIFLFEIGLCLTGDLVE
jgi:hypothetical protein